MNGLTEIFAVLRAVITSGQNIGAHRKPNEQIDQQADNRRGGADCRQRIVSGKLPHYDDVCCIEQELEVKTPGIETPVSRLSGGNVQKVLVGREIAACPTFLMTAYAVRGLDIHPSHTIYRLLDEQKQNGVAVVYVGEDLDVLLAISDRILVLCDGKVNGILDGRTATKEEIGLRMTTRREANEA